MKIAQLKQKIQILDKTLARLYPDVERAKVRLTSLTDSFANKYGADRDVMLLSVPGRSEICGNHTDHNGGVCIAGAISRDIVAVVSARDDGLINVQSEGRVEDSMTVKKCESRNNFPRYKAAALIGGVVGGFMKRGYNVGGFDAYTTTEVLAGSGLSSSAAFEVMIANILNHLYNDGKIDNKELARVAQYAENEYFGKPSGLMDQMACAVGGFVYMDFSDPSSPKVESVEFSLGGAGYALAIVGTGGSHSSLNDDYASVPSEMRAVAAELGREVLSGVSEDEIVSAIPRLRKTVRDRAVLRALHFVRECDRVRRVHSALKGADVEKLVTVMKESGHSSFEYLQNVYTNKDVGEQGLSLALALSDGYLAGKSAAYRVHGGGFAGTIQAVMPKSDVSGYVKLLDGAFGEGATMVLDIRPDGAIRII